MDLRKRGSGAASTGRPAVYRLGYLDAAVKDAREILTEDQYAHLVQQFDLLALDQDPRRPASHDVRPIEGLYELREKGGVLGRLNVRVFFAVLDEENLIVVLGCFKKEAEGQTPTHIKLKMRNRMRIALSLLRGGEGGKETR